MSLQFSPFVTELEAYTPGLSMDEIRERYGIERVIKLASNENPLGTSPLVQERLQRHAANAFRYPAGGNPRLVKALAAHHGVSPKRIVAGNGSDEIIDLLFRLLAVPGVHNAVAFRPCFGIYTTQARLGGVELRQAPLREDFTFPWNDLLALVDEHTRLVFVTSPDNPSGVGASADELAELARALPSSCLLVLDEAYADFAGDSEAEAEAFSLLPRLHEFSSIAILRTFSKSRGLAGLRLGYGIVPEAVAEHFWRARLPFSVNLLAEEAGLAALEDSRFYAETLRVCREGRRQLLDALPGLGCTPLPSQANFVMCRLPDSADPALVNERLLQQGVIVRPLKSYGLPRYTRISVGTAEENSRFLHALERALHAMPEGVSC